MEAGQPYAREMLASPSTANTWDILGVSMVSNDSANHPECDIGAIWRRMLRGKGLVPSLQIKQFLTLGNTAPEDVCFWFGDVAEMQLGWHTTIPNVVVCLPTYAVVNAEDHGTDLLRIPYVVDNPVEGADKDPLAGYEQYAEADWDGYGAEPITAETLQLARKLLGVMPHILGKPDIAPSADGSIGLEWISDASPTRRLFMDIGPGLEWWAYWQRRDGEFGRLPGKLFTSETATILGRLFDELSRE